MRDGGLKYVKLKNEKKRHWAQTSYFWRVFRDLLYNIVLPTLTTEKYRE